MHVDDSMTEWLKVVQKQYVVSVQSTPSYHKMLARLSDVMIGAVLEYFM